MKDMNMWERKKEHDMDGGALPFLVATPPPAKNGGHSTSLHHQKTTTTLTFLFYVLLESNKNTKILHYVFLYLSWTIVLGCT